MAKPNAQTTAMSEVRSGLLRMSEEFKRALPAHIKAEKFIRVAVTAIQENPDLLEANRPSLYAAITKCAQDGLIPDKREAVLVIFKSNVVYMPMVAGVMKKARNSGEIGSIHVGVAYADDVFDYYIDEKGPHIRHVPKIDGELNDKNITHAYCVASTKDQAIYIEVMTKAEVDKIRACSKSPNKGPWVDWYAEQAKKTVIRRICKRLPSSTDLENVVRAEDHMYDLNKSGAVDVTPSSEPVAPARLTAVVEKEDKQAEPVATEVGDANEDI